MGYSFSKVSTSGEETRNPKYMTSTGEGYPIRTYIVMSCKAYGRESLNAQCFPTQRNGKVLLQACVRYPIANARLKLYFLKALIVAALDSTD